MKTGRPVGRLDMRGVARRVSAGDAAIYSARLGQRVRDARLERDLSCEELEYATGVSAFTIWCIERGRTRSPKFDTLVKIALGMGMQPSELIP